MSTWQVVLVSKRQMWWWFRCTADYYQKMNRWLRNISINFKALKEPVVNPEGKSRSFSNHWCRGSRNPSRFLKDSDVMGLYYHLMGLLQFVKDHVRTNEFVFQLKHKPSLATIFAQHRFISFCSCCFGSNVMPLEYIKLVFFRNLNIYIIFFKVQPILCSVSSMRITSHYIRRVVFTSCLKVTSSTLIF